MAYVIDTSSLMVVSNYYPDRFPSFWRQFDSLVESGRIVSVREVRKELERQSKSPHLTEWAGRHPKFFEPPTSEDMDAVAKILAIPHFQGLIGKKQQLTGQPAADPWVVARAMRDQRALITEERFKPNAPKLPNVCTHFGVECIDLEALLERESWTF